MIEEKKAIPAPAYKRGISLQNKLLQDIVLPLGLAFALMIFMLGLKIDKSARESIEKNAMNLIKARPESISYWLGGYKRWLKNICQDPELQNKINSPEEMETWLQYHCLDEQGGNLVGADRAGNAVLYRKDKIGLFNIKGKSDYNAIIEEGKIGKNSIPWMIDGKGLVLVYPSEDVRLKISFQDFDKQLGYTGYKKIQNDVIQSKGSDMATIIDTKGNTNIVIWTPVKDTPGWT